MTHMLSVSRTVAWAVTDRQILQLPCQLVL